MALPHCPPSVIDLSHPLVVEVEVRRFGVELSRFSGPPRLGPQSPQKRVHMLERTNPPPLAELRAEAIKLARSADKLFPEVASDLGVATEPLRNWMLQTARYRHRQARRSNDRRARGAKAPTSREQGSQGKREVLRKASQGLSRIFARDEASTRGDNDLRLHQRA